MAVSPGAGQYSDAGLLCSCSGVKPRSSLPPRSTPPTPAPRLSSRLRRHVGRGRTVKGGAGVSITLSLCRIKWWADPRTKTGQVTRLVRCLFYRGPYCTRDKPGPNLTYPLERRRWGFRQAPVNTLTPDCCLLLFRGETQIVTAASLYTTLRFPPHSPPPTRAGPRP